MEYVLTANALKKRYGKFTALNGLSAHIPKGSIYGLVGKNGAGKTTLIRMVCGLQEPNEGEYFLYGKQNGGKEIARMRRRMGAVAESPALYGNLSAAENLKMQFRVLGMPAFDGVNELLKTVGLENTGNKKVKNFSLGMRQRLGIAVALAGSPDFLVLDEPVNGLDPQGIVEVRELILRLNRERGITVLVSSHILDELSRLATHYGFMDGGYMVKEICAEELESACRKCTQAEVSDTAALARVLDKMGLEYSVLSEREADIFGKVPVTRLAAAYAKEGGEIFTLKEKDESLESYFIGLLGGARRD
ncbi:MAG: ATP-binding cassette domain-containing protein [Clostridia bacterium]|jgi:ABC-2 type transport system ATP-binding protein|nr:ATP-binding cassette domain-containing protein [Clostridia bacterium]